MSLSLEKYIKLKRQVDQLKSEHDRVIGALEETQARLKSDFGCSSDKQAEKLLVKLEQEEQELKRQFHKELKLFEKELQYDQASIEN